MGKGTGTRPAMTKAWYRKHRERVIANVVAYRKGHLQQIKEYLHQYYLDNKERLRAYRKAWYQANKPHVLAKAAKYQATHKEQVKAWAREGRKRRKDWLKRTPKQRQVEYRQNRETIIARSRAWRAGRADRRFARLPLRRDSAPNNPRHRSPQCRSRPPAPL